MWKPQLTREHNVTIMDAFIADHSPTQSQLAKVNLVRIWLRVLTLSDITDIEGRHIESWAQSGLERRESSLHWPRQDKPTSAAICLWRNYITSKFDRNPSTIRSRTAAVPLEHQLGQWIHQLHIIHRTYWDTHKLYV